MWDAAGIRLSQDLNRTGVGAGGMDIQILSISDVDGRTRVAATVDEDGNGVLLIYDKNGKESARLPAR